MTEPRYTRVALYLQDKHPIRDGMEYARYAEARGFEAVWQAESRLVRDAIVPMAAFAAEYQQQALGDYQLFLEAVRSGQLPAAGDGP